MNKKELIEENENLKQLLVAQRDCMGEMSIKLNKIEMCCEGYRALIDMGETVDPKIVIDMLDFIQREAVY